MQGRLQTGDPPGPVPPALTLLIASEVRFLRESLGEVLGRDGAMTVLGYGEDSGQTLRRCHELRPDMLLLDAAVRDGIAAVRELHAAMAGLRIVVFAIVESLDTILQWAEAGIAGYIPSAAALADLQAIVADISAGRQNCSASVSAGLLRRVGAAAPLPAPPAGPPLTAREREIVGLIGSGLSNKDIARRLNIGLATTKSHVHSVLTKLGLQRRGQAASWMHVRAPHP
jgi:DNA-binding NarL/FixJ family response regulator